MSTAEQPKEVHRVRFSTDIEYEIVRAILAIKQAAHAVETAAKSWREAGERHGR